MCRLFGLHSNNRTSVKQALLMADNALAVQSQAHQDGWGIAYYNKGVPHIIKSLGCAHQSDGFHKLGQNIQTHTLIAHIRSATQGEISLVNCHPFQHGHWIMAHNGDMPSFNLIREELVSISRPEFLLHTFGNTDSELYFALVLSELQSLEIIDMKKPPINKIAQAVRNSVEKIEHIYQRLSINDEPSLNLLLSNGQFLLGFRLRRDLHYSYDSCMMLSSEPLGDGHTWQPIAERQIVAVDHDMRLYLDY